MKLYVDEDEFYPDYSLQAKPFAWAAGTIEMTVEELTEYNQVVDAYMKWHGIIRERLVKNG